MHVFYIGWIASSSLHWWHIWPTTLNQLYFWLNFKSKVLNYSFSSFYLAWQSVNYPSTAYWMTCVVMNESWSSPTCHFFIGSKIWLNLNWSLAQPHLTNRYTHNAEYIFVLEWYTIYIPSSTLSDYQCFLLLSATSWVPVAEWRRSGRSRSCSDALLPVRSSSMRRRTSRHSRWPRSRRQSRLTASSARWSSPSPMWSMTLSSSRPSYTPRWSGSQHSRACNSWAHVRSTGCLILIFLPWWVCIQKINLPIFAF